MAKRSGPAQGDVQVVTDAERIVAHLNQILGTSYRHTTAVTAKLIAGLLKSGYTFEDFQYVHLVKAQDWLGSDMEKYLRPKTLYAASNFENYRNQKPKTQRLDRNAQVLSGWLDKKRAGNG